MKSKILKMDNQLTHFGFCFERGGAHTSRTMMLKELGGVLSYVDRPEAMKKDYLSAIDEENCLGKRSGKTRILTYRHLVELYALDPSLLLFRALLYFWKRDPSGQPLSGFLCAYARDSILRSSASFILKFPPGAVITREALEERIEAQEPGRFSKATLKSTAQNINSTWTQSGHLTGRRRKIRSVANPTDGSVSYALLLGYLAGFRGESLFQTEYTQLLDCPFNRLLELTEDASRKGWLIFKRVGNVMEVLFPNLLTPQEREWIHEQG
ncbi:hypothetical protein WDW89_26300 [Deltaproteobacteria bacterium TL4]